MLTQPLKCQWLVESFVLKRVFTVIEKFTTSALHVKGGQPFNACICCRYDACNSLLPHLSEPILPAGAPCLYSEQTIAIGSDLPREAQHGWGPKWKPGLCVPPCPLSCLLLTCLSSILWWSGYSSEPNNQHSFLEERLFIISLQWSHSGWVSSLMWISVLWRIHLKKHLFIMPSAGIETYLGCPDKLLRFYSINCADRKAELQSNHTI